MCCLVSPCLVLACDIILFLTTWSAVRPFFSFFLFLLSLSLRSAWLSRFLFLPFPCFFSSYHDLVFPRHRHRLRARSQVYFFANTIFFVPFPSISFPSSKHLPHHRIEYKIRAVYASLSVPSLTKRLFPPTTVFGDHFVLCAFCSGENETIIGTSPLCSRKARGNIQARSVRGQRRDRKHRVE